MGDESALEARLERAHTVIGDLLRSLGEVELLPERQQAAAREAIAVLEDAPITDVADFGMRLVDRIKALGILDDSELRVFMRRLIYGGPKLRAGEQAHRLTADLVQSEERRKRAEAAALAAEQHLHAIRHAAGLSPGEWGDIAATIIERLRGSDELSGRLKALCQQLQDNGVAMTATT